MKQAVGPLFRALEIDAEGALPLYRQLYDLLREALISGAIPAGSRLPSTRSLAQDLGLSRNTVTAAFDRLLDEGLIESRVGAGSFASEALAEELYLEGAPPRSLAVAEYRAPGRRRLSRRALDADTRGAGRDPQVPRPFSIGVPALAEFPRKSWQRLVSRHVRSFGTGDLAHGSPEGDPRLRELLARHLGTSRGVRCRPEQILILPSAQLGLDLAGRLLLDPGEKAWVEEPGYLGARGALRFAGARLVPVPVDEEGLRVDVGRQRAAEARLAYVTPSHQFPLGYSMSLRRRLQLLAWAHETGSWILEDDYDSEYRYEGPAARALQGLDRADRVLYLGTFSKVLFPAVRVAYLVVPPDLVEPFVNARFLVDGHVSPSTQAVLADFIEEGHLVGHLRRMRRLYRARRDCLLDQAQLRFGERLRFAGVEAGMHVSARLAEGRDADLVRAAAFHDLDLAPLSGYFLGPDPWQGLAFGYAHVPEEEIVVACEVIERLLG